MWLLLQCLGNVQCVEMLIASLPLYVPDWMGVVGGYTNNLCTCSVSRVRCVSHGTSSGKFSVTGLNRPCASVSLSHPPCSSGWTRKHKALMWRKDEGGDWGREGGQEPEGNGNVDDDEEEEEEAATGSSVKAQCVLSHTSLLTYLHTDIGSYAQTLGVGGWG